MTAAKTPRELMAIAEQSAEYFQRVIDSLRAEIAAPKAAQPVEPADLPVNWAGMIHYPDCWDTAAYPALRDAIHECLAWSGCSVCKPAQPAPAAPYQVTDGDAFELLADLAKALDSSHISSWQTTAGWSKELAAALDYVEARKAAA